MVKIIVFYLPFILCSITSSEVTREDPEDPSEDKRLFELLPFKEEQNSKTFDRIETIKNFADLHEENDVDSNVISSNQKTNKERFRRSTRKRFRDENQESFYGRNSVPTYGRPHRTPDYDYDGPELMVFRQPKQRRSNPRLVNQVRSEINEEMENQNTNADEDEDDEETADDPNTVVSSPPEDTKDTKKEQTLPSETPILQDAINDVVQTIVDIKELINHSDDQYMKGMRRAIDRTVLKFRSKNKKKRKSKDTISEITDTLKEFSKVIVDLPKTFTELASQLKNSTMALVDEVVNSGKKSQKNQDEDKDEGDDPGEKKKNKRTSEEEDEDDDDEREEEGEEEEEEEDD